MHPDLPTVLRDLLEPGGTAGRVLVTGWFSFRDGEVTAGDVLAQRAVSDALGRLGIAHDTAWSPVFDPGALTLEAALPERYEQVLFVCGPLHGHQVDALHERYSRCRRLAVGVSVIATDAPAVTGFHRVVARDGPDGPPLPDLSSFAPAGRPLPVAGLALTWGQGEYGFRRGHAETGETLRDWLGGKDCARVEADTRLAHDGVRLCRTADQYLSLVARLDIMVTDRLHGMVLALRSGVPVLAVDPVRGGAKVSAQAAVLRWPATLPCETLDEQALDRWWDWCLSPAGRAAAGRRRTRMAHTG
ncbi:polysaccharide pyruvyl transferase family protein [Streptomyces sp. NPDC006971]|uniref:polysaccharide pyruvyl transferase family protein n=1 Tax=Streptomyces sp. NPDC006971 TaxID=3154784 RepID=UPI0033F7E7D8